MARRLTTMSWMLAVWLTLNAAPKVVDAGTSIWLRVVDQHGTPVPNFDLMLWDTTRLSGHVDARGCGTYHPQEGVWTDDAGFYKGWVPFKPNKVSYQVDEFEPTDGVPMPTDGGLVVHRMSFETFKVTVTDAQGKPLDRVTGQVGDGSGRTDATGVLSVTARTDHAPLPKVSLRRMGYRPVSVQLPATAPVRLEDRAWLDITVFERDGGVATDRMTVEAIKDGEPMSYCTINVEDWPGGCSLDTEPGHVMIKLRGSVVSQLDVKPGRTSAKVIAPPQPKPPHDMKQ